MNITSANLALMQMQTLNSLTNSSPNADGSDSFASVFSLLVSNGAPSGPLSSIAPSDPLALIAPSAYVNQSSSVKGIAPTGRNMALFDPESAYKMMTSINNKDVAYKAQFSELSQMRSSVSGLEGAGKSLGNIGLSTANDSIQLQLHSFVGQYNNWIQQYNPDVQQGGLLADTQAAQASRFELEQNFNNPLFGVKDGVQGLRAMGVSIDPYSHLATLDSAKLGALLANNKQGVVDTLQEFGANFAKSANLLNADGNFFVKQLDNLSHAIHFIADNKNALQQEFGSGDAVHPTGKVAQALAVYNQIIGA